MPFPYRFNLIAGGVKSFIFLSLPVLNVETKELTIIQKWLETDFAVDQVLYIAIDRTTWGRVNLLMISCIWEKRAIPIYFELLPKLGNSTFDKQTTALQKVFTLLKPYKIVVLGDREFCSVTLGNWLREQKVYFCLRLKTSEFVQLESEIWMQLNDLGLTPGVSFYLQGVKVTKTKKIDGFSIARVYGSVNIWDWLQKRGGLF